MAYRINVPYNGMSVAECAQRTRNAIYQLRWGIPYESPNGISASVPISLLSWGETFRVVFYQDFFQVESKCAFVLQIIDWGKNRSNVDQFMRCFYASAPY